MKWSSEQLGILFSISAYLLWGLLPLYLKSLEATSALEVVCHRIFWSWVLLSIGVLGIPSLRKSLLALKDRKAVGMLVVTSILIGLNWLLFIYAVEHEQTLEASFGYFISPLIVIALGVFLLKESLSRAQKISLSFACIGVGYQLVSLGALPWISLVLATSFAMYGFLRKRMSVGAYVGLWFETLLLVPFSLGYLAFLSVNQELVFLHKSSLYDLWLMASGIFTTLPLVLFAASVRRIPFSKVGFLQYLSPLIQFMVAVLLFQEPLSMHKLVSFIWIWSALAILMITPFLKIKRRNSSIC